MKFIFNKYTVIPSHDITSIFPSYNPLPLNALFWWQYLIITLAFVGKMLKLSPRTTATPRKKGSGQRRAWYKSASVVSARTFPHIPSSRGILGFGDGHTGPKDKE